MARAEAANATLVTRSRTLAVLADAGRIVQTLTNLIHNAIMFSEPSKIVAVGVQARAGATFAFTLPAPPVPR